MRAGLFKGILLTVLGFAAACGNDPLPIYDGAPDVFMPDTIGDPPDAMVCEGTLGYLEVGCTANTDCTTCYCQLFVHERVCTKMCSGPADCPAPSTGCMGGWCQPQ